MRVQAITQIGQLPGGEASVIAQARMLALAGRTGQAEALLLEKAQPEDAVAMYCDAGDHLAAIRYASSEMMLGLSRLLAGDKCACLSSSQSEQRTLPPLHHADGSLACGTRRQSCRPLRVDAMQLA